MSRKFYLNSAILLGLSLLLWLSSSAQQAVRIGNSRFVPEQNVPLRATRGVIKGSSLDLGEPTGGQLNVLLQFDKLPTAQQAARLKDNGIKLESYINGNAYFATLPAGTNRASLGGLGLRSVLPIAPEWRLSPELQDAQPPEWAVSENGRVRVSLNFFSNANPAEVRRDLKSLDASDIIVSELFHNAHFTIPEKRVSHLADLPWLESAHYTGPKPILLNNQGRILSGANFLNQPSTLGGYNLTGKGVKVGIWDGNVQPHVDYAARLHQHEFEYSVKESHGHGMHVAGSVGSAGLLNPHARGMAPKADLYTWNYTGKINGLTIDEEMARCHLEDGIVLTQNSYGIPLWAYCTFAEILSYKDMTSDQEIDKLSALYPKLTHVFAGGNDQGSCGYDYRSVTSRSKNAIYVGALRANGEMTDFSSWGPTDDGRIIPHVCAKGEHVFSTMPFNLYSDMSGTSMACPTTTGHLALLIERYRQLYSGDTPENYLLKAIVANTADDAGITGPDYAYGYGILNAVHALKAIDNGWFKKLTVESGTKLADQTINVPEGTKQLKVMLVWSDPWKAMDYEWGRNIIANDLDLVVESNGTRFLPWACQYDKSDPQNPENYTKPAIRKPIDFDNIEQVTIDNPTPGPVTVMIGGEDKISTNSEQPCALVWYFDDGQSSVTYPIGGESMDPGEKFMIRTDNIHGDALYEISYDGGQNFQSLGTAGSPAAVLTMPEDAPLGDNCIVRVTDMLGNIAISRGKFQVMPVPKDLAISQEGCGADGWKLSWQACTGVDSYRVYRANMKTEEFEQIGEVAGAGSGKVEFVVPTDNVILGGTNLFSVRSVKGTMESDRSVGVVAKQTTSKPVTFADLPIREDFQKWPSAYYSLKRGKNIDLDFVETPPKVKQPLGSYMMAAIATKQPADWSKPFEHTDNVLDIQICDLDLTSVKSGTKLVFSTLHKLAYRNDAKDIQMRLVANGNEIVPTSEGGESLKGNNNIKIAVFDISKYAGTTVSLSLQAAMRNRDITFYMVNFQILNPTESVDIQLSDLVTPEDRPKMGIENLSFHVRNMSYKRIEDLPVAIKINGEVKTSTVVAELTPFGEKTIEIPVDFSVKKKGGEILNLEVIASYQDDVDQKNNILRGRVRNFGLVIPMPTSYYQRLPTDQIIQVNPSRTEVVKGSVIFTDDGGLIDDYSDDQVSTIQFVPNDPNSRLKATVKSYGMYEDLEFKDILNVYKYRVPYDVYYGGFNIKNLPPSYYLSKDGLFETVRDASGNASDVLVTADPAQMSFLSEALDGSLTFHFESAGFHRASGWEIEITEEVKNNDMTLVEVITPTAYPDRWFPMIRVRNNTAKRFERVGVLYGLSETQQREDEFVLEPFEEKVVVLRQPIQIGAPFVDRMDIVIGIDLVKGIGNFLDDDMTDNLAQVPIKSDTYWTGGEIVDPSKAAIARVSLGTQVFTYRDYERHSRQLEYKLNSLRFNLYTQSVNPVLIKTSHIKEQQDGGKLYMWIDINNDGRFEDAAPEMYEATLKEGQRDYVMNVDLRGVEPGVRRVRFLICGKSDMQAFKAGKTIEWGHAIDGLFGIHNNTNPSVRDLGVLNITGPTTGVALSRATPVSVLVVNNGIKPATNIKLKLYVDAVDPNNSIPVATEIIKDTIAPQGGELRYTFKTKIDLSSVGDHEIKVQLPDDGSNADNTTTLHVTCLPSQSTDGVYALRMIRRTTSFGQEVVENIKFSEFPFALGMNAATVEMWANIDKDWTETGATDATVSSLIASAGFTLATTYRIKDMPNRGYLIKLGNTFWASESWIVKTEKWQHYAVTFEKESDSFVRPHLYVDGEEIPLTMIRGSISHIDFRTFFMGLRVSGYLKGLRIWNKIRTVQELKDNWLSVLRQGGDRGPLPEGCMLEMPMNEGRGAILASGNYLAIIRNSRINLPISNPNSTWTKLTNFVKTATVEGQITETRKEEIAQISGRTVKKFTILLPYNYASLDNVPVMIETQWPDFTIEANGQKAKNGTISLTFTKDTPEITLTCKHNSFFGQRVSEDFLVRVEKDASTDCDLKALSILAADNMNLKEDVVIDPVSSRSILLNLENKSASEKVDISRLVVQIDRLSTGAALHFQGQTIGEGGKVTLDLTSPKALLITAANGRDSKSYELRLERTQTVTWPTQTMAYVFGAANVPLTATMSSGLPAQYFSSDPQVATVDGHGNLIIVGAGAAQITAYHPGNGSYLPSTNKIAQDVNVTPKDATIAVKSESIEQGESLPEFMYQSTDLVRQEKPGDYVKFPYAVFLADGTQWDPMMPQLQPGTYSLKPVGYTAPYASGNYNVTLENGTLTVTKGGTNTKSFTLTLKEGTTPKPDVEVVVNGVSYQTDAQGMLELMFKPGTYTYSIMVDGFASIKSEFTIENDPVSVEETLVRVDPAKLIYAVEGEGVIFGVANQMLSKGQTGSLVVAMPRVGHHFVKWLDNESTDPSRQDVAVAESQSFTAQFAPNRVTLNYMVGEGGEKVSDPATFMQEIDQYTDAAPVEVRAMDGYFFYRWSDGVRTLSRTDMKVKEDKEVKALFVRPFLLPFSENFNDEDRLSTQWSVGASDLNYKFVFVPARYANYAFSDYGGMAYAPLLQSTTNRLTRLVSPRFNVEKLVDQDVIVDFDYYKFFYVEGLSELKLQYRVDDGEWMTLLEDLPGTAEAQIRHAQTILESHNYQGARYLQFSWLAQGRQTNFAIDNIQIDIPDYPTFNALYFTDEFGHLQVAGNTEKKKRVQLEVVNGVAGAFVTAVPNPGYSFDYWSDGRMDNPRRDSARVNVKAYFITDRAKTYYLNYSAEVGGYIEGITRQRIHKFQDGVEVTARPYGAYNFLGWSDGKFKGQATRQDSYIESNINVKAIFAKGQIVLQYDAGEGGTMLTDARVEYANDKVEIAPAQVQVKHGYKFLYWVDEEGNQYPTNPFVPIGVTNGDFLTFKAIYEKQPVLVYTAGKGGMLNTHERRWEVSVSKGENGPSVEAVPLSGYVFESWSDGVTDNPRQDLNVMSDKSVQAIFAQKTYMLTIVVMHEGAPVANAEVNLMGTTTTAMTDAEGKVIFTVNRGTIPYSVKKEGYLVVAENAEISDDKTVNVDLGKLKAETNNPVTSADESDLLANVVVTPNPFDSHIQLSNVNEMQSVQLISLSGVLLRMVEHNGEPTLMLKTADLPEGVYIIRMFDKEGKARLVRVVKQR